MPSSLPQRLVQEVFTELYSRKGFDHFWDDIDRDIQQEIIDSCTHRVVDVLCGKRIYETIFGEDA